MTERTEKAVAALSGLSRDEREALAVEKLRDCDLDREIAALESTLAPLWGLAAPIEPTPALWDKIEAAVAEAEAGLKLSHEMPFAEGNWTRLAEGVEIKPLWDARTYMVRCAPGSSIPPHPHFAFEHTVVLSGDMEIAGIAFGVGDYHGMPSGADHGAISSRHGCVLLLAYVG